MSCLLLEDPVRNVTLQAYTQPLMVPARAVARMRNSTTESYPLQQTGFAITVGQAVAEEFNVTTAFFAWPPLLYLLFIVSLILQVSPTEWQFEINGISRRDVLVLAAKTLANSYKL